MELLEMLAELRELVDDEEIYNDACEHTEPANASEFCSVCFILNLSDHVSEEEESFIEETTEKQRQTIEELWQRWANS